MSTPKDELRNRIIENITWIIQDSYEVGYDNGQESREPLHADTKLNNLVKMVDDLATSSQQQLIERIRKELDKTPGRINLIEDESLVTKKQIGKALDTVMEELKK